MTMVSPRSMIIRMVSKGKHCPMSAAAIFLLTFSLAQIQIDFPAKFVSMPWQPEIQRQKDNGQPEVMDVPHSTSSSSSAKLSQDRQTFANQCDENNHQQTFSTTPNDHQREIQEYLTTIFKSQNQIALPKTTSNDDPVKPCPYAFIDLGSNIGDTLGKFIDAGFGVCRVILGRKRNHARFNLTSGVLELGPGNQLIRFVRNTLRSVDRFPEEYCFVGVEGNPVFTKRLQEMERRVMTTIPRPVRTAHFYTETVGAGTDGPTVLYLDTINAKDNFWGSSILETHKDAQKSAAHNNNATIKVSVMGITLSTLLKRTVQSVNGSHVIIKIDIEGGEYSVMNEAIDTLCKYTSAGVKVDLILETHSPRVTGKVTQDMRLFRTRTKDRIRDCNINSGTLAGGSH